MALTPQQRYARRLWRMRALGVASLVSESYEGQSLELGGDLGGQPAGNLELGGDFGGESAGSLDLGGESI